MNIFDTETAEIISALLAYDGFLQDKSPTLPNRMKAMALAIKSAQPSPENITKHKGESNE